MGSSHNDVLDLAETPANSRMEPARLTVLCDHVAAARGSFGTLDGLEQAVELLETLISAAVTLVAAFGGSWSAFKLTDRDKARQTVRDQIAAINRAQFVLIQQLSALKNIQSKMIEPKRTDRLRLINMRPTLPVGGSVPRLDPDGLLFLLETEDRELPFLLMVEQQRFDVAVQATNERSRLHIEELQPRLTAASIEEGGEYSPAALAKLLGDDLLLRLQRATDSMVEQVDLTVASCTALIGTFHAAMKARFPKATIIRVDPSQPSNPYQPSPRQGRKSSPSGRRRKPKRDR